MFLSFTFWTYLSQISYQYYSIIGVLVTIIVSHFVQIIIYLVNPKGYLFILYKQ